MLRFLDAFGGADCLPFWGWMSSSNLAVWEVLAASISTNNWQELITPGKSSQPFRKSGKVFKFPGGAQTQPGRRAWAHGHDCRPQAPFDDRNLQAFVKNWSFALATCGSLITMSVHRLFTPPRHLLFNSPPQDCQLCKFNGLRTNVNLSFCQILKGGTRDLRNPHSQVSSAPPFLNAILII